MKGLETILNAEPDTLIILGGEKTKELPQGTKPYSRSDCAVKLFKIIYGQLGYQPNIICTGYKSGLNPEQRSADKSEANLSKKYLLEQGIPAKKIFIEDHSQDALTNMIFSWDLLLKLKAQKIGLINEPDDMFRVLWSAKRVYGNKFEFIGCPTPERSDSPLFSKLIGYPVIFAQGIDLWYNSIPPGDYDAFKKYAEEKHPFTGKNPSGAYNLCVKLFSLMTGSETVRNTYNLKK